jgi:uncharacterized membrane protein
MAGIGFQLRRLARQETLSAVVAAAGHAAVVAAGPWLFTIFSLASITLLTERIAGLETLATFRVIVIYSFAVSLVLASPIAIVVTRLVADALWSRQPERVRALLFAGYGLALAVTAAGVALILVLFPLPRGLAVALAANSLLVSLIWVALALCGAVRDYRGVTWSFLIGLVVSLLAAVLAAIAGLRAAGIALGFLVGLSLTFIGLTLRVLMTFPQPMTDPGVGFKAMAGGLRQYWALALGSLAGSLGVWIDKWVFWGSPVGETVEGGLRHAPLYDSAMFIASLVIIPALSSFVVKLETGFFERYQNYFATIRGHGTAGQIERSRQELASYTLENLMLITVAQGGICAVLILTAPLLIELLSMQFRQIAILRYGALGAAFQFIYIAATSVLLFFDRRRLYLGIQLLFLGLVSGLSVLSVTLGDDYYGTGYFLACALSSLIAYVVADSTFRNLNYLTFIGNNPSIEPAEAYRGGWRRLLGRRRAA